ncbi:THAP domain-containing protein 11-like [Rhipicephalus sanguineus]|uniref:THAP domain-containing protein 11-like n=1 Tax=Rhipicephalus sanguineus TaxID=34632 RepID=UPI0020C56E21|nr:THAP domain-containing protein 11-like [Rhipicephalus sanguineus]
MFSLYRFPSSPELQKKWVASVNRKNFRVSPSSRLCSRHFVGGKKTDENNVPMLHLGYQRKVVVGRRRLVRQEYLPKSKKKRVNDDALSDSAETSAQASEGTPLSDTENDENVPNLCKPSLNSDPKAAFDLGGFQSCTAFADMWL